jgi:adenine-specific DNA-methyltransferase
VRKRALGQFFTVDPAVQSAMVGLVTHRTGRALEPSAGAGHLAAALAVGRPSLALTCVEIDPSTDWAHPFPREIGEFLSWSAPHDGGFDVVFGNPPYVAWKDVDAEVRDRAQHHTDGWHGKVNLYHLFIARCAELLAPGGELVFIVPMDWLFQTATAPLRKLLGSLGALTDLIHLGEAPVFPDAAVPSLCIFRFQRGARQGKVRYRTGLDGTVERRTLVRSTDRWLVLDDDVAALVRGWPALGEQYDVRVGMVTGADGVFRLAPGQVERSCVRRLVTTKRRLEPFLDVNRFDDIDDVPPRARELLVAHRDELLARRIRSFDDTNWWQWGAVRNAEAMRSPTERFFALAKTRSAEPFFSVTDGAWFSAGVLGLFRRDGSLPVDTARTVANSPAFRAVLEGMLLTSGDKVQLQPATLADAPFPPDAAAVASLLASQATPGASR